MTDSRWKGAVCGLAAAALFGASAPFAKVLLPGTGPLMLAGVLYLGAGLALTIVRLLRRRGGSQESGLRRSDFGWLAGIVVLGGIVGPVLMLFGLGRVSGVAGSLLLNLEAPFTMLLAVLFFGDHLGARGVGAAVFVVTGAAVLSYRPGELHADLLGMLAIAGACASWALDNNFTQRLSLRDPIAVVHIKALGAGSCVLAVSLATGDALPGAAVLLPALLLGVLAYGASIVLDMYALRLLGAAREAALFATAPFIGAVIAIPLLGERPAATDVAAGALMGAGIVLLLRERHRHTHTHDEVEHDHLHLHDEHHQHEHESPGPVGEPHSHPHRQASLTHDHPHVPDPHHRHRH